MQENASECSIHFTYSPDPDMHSLCQGDVLEATDELNNILREIHPYFTNEQYRYFMVLTQSCDLIRRNDKPCKSQYITLAAVRSFSDFFKKAMVSKQLADNAGTLMLMDISEEIRAYQLIERVYNNTEPDYFFLYKEDNLAFPESMVAYLKVSIALKAFEHYDICLAAKIMELKEEFKAKLGWLVGNIYSRVGTVDWSSLMNNKAKEKMIKNEIKSRCLIKRKEEIEVLKRFNH